MQVFYAIRFVFSFVECFVLCGVLEVGEDRFPSGRVPVLFMRINVGTAGTSVLVCEEVTVEKHIS